MEIKLNGYLCKQEGGEYDGEEGLHRFDRVSERNSNSPNTDVSQ